MMLECVFCLEFVAMRCQPVAHSVEAGSGITQFTCLSPGGVHMAAAFYLRARVVCDHTFPQIPPLPLEWASHGAQRACRFTATLFTSPTCRDIWDCAHLVHKRGSGTKALGQGRALISVSVLFLIWRRKTLLSYVVIRSERQTHSQATVQCWASRWDASRTARLELADELVSGTWAHSPQDQSQEKLAQTGQAQPSNLRHQSSPTPSHGEEEAKGKQFPKGVWKPRSHFVEVIQSEELTNLTKTLTKFPEVNTDALKTFFERSFPIQLLFCVA